MFADLKGLSLQSLCRPLSSCSASPPPWCRSDVGEAEGGQQAEHAAAAERRAQRPAAQSSGGRRRHHQNAGGGASAAPAAGKASNIGFPSASMLWIRHARIVFF